MDVKKRLTRTAIAPADILSGAHTIRANNADICFLNINWITPTTFVDWSQRGLTDGDEYGRANAIMYAKRAVSCRIDRLISNYHQRHLHRATFPVKIKALQSIGITIPSVIQELVIDPRNDLEHNYVPPDPDVARRAIDIAKLFLAATDANDDCGSVIALNMNLLYSWSQSADRFNVTFKGWSDGAMLFIDVFAEPQEAKIVDGKKGEVLYAELSDFSVKEAVELGSILHSHFSLPNRGESGMGRAFYEELKREAGF